MSDKSDSSLARMLSVLDLFNERQQSWTAEAITEALRVSLPTGYRYVRMLTDAGLLQRASDSHYSLGPRIMVLDHYIRQADPVLRHAIPFMKELVTLTGFDCVVSGLYGRQILDTHQELSPTPANLSYGRGRPRPLFRGAAPKLILAQLPPAALARIFESHRVDIIQAGLPAEWPEFRKTYAAVRRAGYAVSVGEVDQNVAAIGVPLQHHPSPNPGALTLISSVDRMALIDRPRLIELLKRAAEDIVGRVRG